MTDTVMPRSELRPLGRNGEKTNRLNVRLSDADRDLLERLQAQLGGLGVTHVVRAALGLLADAQGVPRPALRNEPKPPPPGRPLAVRQRDGVRLTLGRESMAMTRDEARDLACRLIVEAER